MPTEQIIAAPTQQSVSDAYRKAHKNYVLFSGLLAAWELIGITLNTKEKWGIELKSPTGVPLILIVLVFYSGYKTWIEWSQCGLGGQVNWAARLDYTVTHLIALGAISITIVQYALQIQIVNKLELLLAPLDQGLIVVLTFCLGTGFVALARMKRRPQSGWAIIIFFFFMYLLFALVTMVQVARYRGFLHLVIDIGIGIPLAATLFGIAGKLSSFVQRRREGAATLSPVQADSEHDDHSTDE